MKKKRMVEITETFCDVCGAMCGNHAIQTDFEGTEQHACLSWNVDHGQPCSEVLRQRILEAAIARRKLQAEQEKANSAESQEQASASE